MSNLKDIVSKTLGLKPEMVNNGLSREKSEAWDSFNHLLLISGIEKELGVRFTMAEVEKIKTYKDLADMVGRKARDK